MPRTAPFLPAVLLLACLAGCRQQDDAPAQPATAPAASSTAADGCVPLANWQSPARDTFRFSEETGTDAWRVRLAIAPAGRPLHGGLELPADRRESTIVGNDDVPDWTQVCGGHLLVVNLAAERGGTLAIGNLRDDALAMTALDYASGDEDTARLDFRDGALLVTDANGTRRLRQDDAPDAAVPLGYVAESLACERNDDHGKTWLKLDVDTDGNPHAIDYLSLMPGGQSCTVSASRSDGETGWEDREGGIDIAWGDEPDAPRVRIERSGDDYRIDTRGARIEAFCGQGAQLAVGIRLRRGTPPCTAVEWPQ